MKRKHCLRCVKEHLYRHGQYLLNEKPNASDYQKGVGDGLLRALDVLNGGITGNATIIYTNNCSCIQPLVPAYDHYEVTTPQPSPTEKTE